MSPDEILEMMRLAYEAPKEAIGAIAWNTDRQRERMLRVPISCDCHPANVTGVAIIGTAWADEPDQRVTFQLVIDVLGSDYRIARVDWRPRQAHTNKYGPDELRGLTLDTSIHDFHENAALGLELMQSKNLPIVKPIDPEPQNFNELLLYVCATFRLQNALAIPEPPWAPQLF